MAWVLDQLEYDDAELAIQWAQWAMENERRRCENDLALLQLQMQIESLPAPPDSSSKE